MLRGRLLRRRCLPRNWGHGRYTDYEQHLVVASSSLAPGALLARSHVCASTLRLSAFQVIPPTVVLLSVCQKFIPESPRWLISRGRDEEGRAIMIKYHSTDGGTSNPLIELQLREFKNMIEVRNLQRKMEAVWDYSSLFSTRAGGCSPSS